MILTIIALAAIIIILVCAAIPIAVLETIFWIVMCLAVWVVVLLICVIYDLIAMPFKMIVKALSKKNKK